MDHHNQLVQGISDDSLQVNEILQVYCIGSGYTYIIIWKSPRKFLFFSYVYEED